jgi:TonB family protein
MAMKTNKTFVRFVSLFSLVITLMICTACSVQPSENPQTPHLEEMRRIVPDKDTQANPYFKKILLKIRSNILFRVPSDLTENDPVEYEVRLFPDGTVLSVTKLKSSKVLGLDEAVMQAIMRSEPFPADSFGNRPHVFTVRYSPLAK